MKRHVRSIDAAIQLKNEVMPNLVQAAREAKAKYDEATKAREQAGKIQLLSKELAWAHVATKDKVSIHPTTL